MSIPPAVGEEPSPSRRIAPLKWGFQLLALAAVAGLLALLVWRLVGGSGGTRLVHEIGLGRRPVAPQFALPVVWPRAETWPRDTRPALGDGRVSLRELRGRPVVLNFWASWCIPCKKEAPRLNAAARAHAGNVILIGIDVQDLESDARNFLRHHDVPYPSVHDNSGTTYDGYGLTAVPETYWLDGRGRIVSHFAGPVSSVQLEEGIRAARTRP